MHNIEKNVKIYLEKIKNNIKSYKLTEKNEKMLYEVFAYIAIAYILISESLIYYFNIAFFRYSDEIVVLASFFIMVFAGLRGRVYISKQDYTITKLLITIVIIGLLSNLIFKVETSITTIIIDLYLYLKIFIAYICLKIILNKEKCIKILKNLLMPSKVFLGFAFVCGIISLFCDIGMSGSVRFGIRSFCFIFEHQHSLAIAIWMSLLIIMCSNSKYKKVYLIMAIVCEILTTKGPSLIIGILSIFCIKYFEKNKKILLKTWMILGLACCVIGSFQIRNYLINEKAPRHLFFKYSIITATEYFPLGSGFATFGSDMAAKKYSDLYVKYGFEPLHGMGRENGNFLNDTYWPMIIGQFGFLGLIMMGYIFYILYNQIMNFKRSDLKAILFLTIFYFFIHSIGSAVLTSSIGVFAFIIIAIVIRANMDDYTHNWKELKVKSICSKIKQIMKKVIDMIKQATTSDYITLNINKSKTIK